MVAIMVLISIILTLRSTKNGRRGIYLSGAREAEGRPSEACVDAVKRKF